MSATTLPAPGALAHSPHRARRVVVLLALGALLLLVCLASIGIGAVPIAPADTVRIIARALGAELTVDARQAAVLLAIRLPRTLLGLLSARAWRWPACSCRVSFATRWPTLG